MARLRFNDIAVVMITCDRSLHSEKHNYLPATLRSLEQSGLFNSDRLAAFNIYVSNPESHPFVHQTINNSGLTKYRNRMHVCTPRESLPACVNAGKALVSGSLLDVTWVLFIEDDVAPCSDFLDSVGRWLDQHGSDKYQLYALGAPYSQTLVNYTRGATAWEYPVSAFYGTQCFAVRPRIATMLGSYLSQNPIIRGVRNPNAYDLMMQDVINAQHVSPMFLASCPSFVQHIGKDSVCTGKPPEDVHTFVSYQGDKWSYQSAEARIVQ